MLCHIPRCADAATGYSKLCPRHKRTKRRHGHPLQRGVTKAELQPYLKRVRRRIKANAKSPLWDHAEARWQALLEACEAHLEAQRSGRAVIRWKTEATAALAKLAAEAEPRAVIETVCAVFLMQASEPQRILSDEAFRTQLARRVLRLGHVHAGTRLNSSTGRIHRWYRDLSPRAAQMLGLWLSETLGAIGLRIARLEERDAETREQSSQTFRDALAALN